MILIPSENIETLITFIFKHAILSIIIEFYLQNFVIASVPIFRTSEIHEIRIIHLISIDYLRSPIIWSGRSLQWR